MMNDVMFYSIILPLNSIVVVRGEKKKFWGAMVASVGGVKQKIVFFVEGGYMRSVYVIFLLDGQIFLGVGAVLASGVFRIEREEI